jgi:hypothetical protein
MPLNGPGFLLDVNYPDRRAKVIVVKHFLKSVHSDGRSLLANTWLRDTPRAQQTALTARPQAILASSPFTFLLWQSPQPP